MLDNVEHVLAGAGVVEQIVQSAPGVTVLVTSRERLHLPGEWVVDVTGLPVPDVHYPQTPTEESAADLFAASARREDAAFVMSPADWPSVVEICRLVDGLPLGIELAAGWIRVLTCPEIARELERGLLRLSGAAAPLPARHRSLWAVLDHSWRLLSAEEQRVLRQLAVFRGGSTRDAAEHVGGLAAPACTLRRYVARAPGPRRAV